jgi:hypothetical protein
MTSDFVTTESDFVSTSFDFVTTGLVSITKMFCVLPVPVLIVTFLGGILVRSGFQTSGASVFQIFMVTCVTTF